MSKIANLGSGHELEILLYHSRSASIVIYLGESIIKADNWYQSMAL